MSEKGFGEIARRLNWLTATKNRKCLESYDRQHPAEEQKKRICEESDTIVFFHICMLYVYYSSELTSKISYEAWFLNICTENIFIFLPL